MTLQEVHGISDRKKHSGSCVIDTDTCLSREEDLEDAWTFLKDELTSEIEASEMTGYTAPDMMFNSFDHMLISDFESLPSERHYFLLEPVVAGFSLQDKTWLYLQADQLTSYQPVTSLANLIIDQNNRDIVLAMTQAQSQSFKIDHISNKGEGLVPLLAGSSSLNQSDLCV